MLYQAALLLLLMFMPMQSCSKRAGGACDSLTCGKGQWLSVEPVSWLSMKVMARLGHMPMTPGGRPWLSTMRQYSRRPTASCGGSGGEGGNGAGGRERQVRTLMGVRHGDGGMRG